MLSIFFLNHKKKAPGSGINHAFRKKYPTFKIGRWSYGLPSVSSWSKDEMLEIGAFCSISDEVKIFTGGEHRTDWVTTFPFPEFFDEFASVKGHPLSKGKVMIGNDVWLAYGATILSGVTIGDDAVIGAQAVVGSNVPPYAIVAGNPAKVIRYRFSSDNIEALKEIAWWNWPDETIKQHMHLLLSPDIEAFIQAGRALNLRKQRRTQ